jgi:hypothetical protein
VQFDRQTGLVLLEDPFSKYQSCLTTKFPCFPNALSATQTRTQPCADLHSNRYRNASGEPRTLTTVNEIAQSLKLAAEGIIEEAKYMQDWVMPDRRVV